MYERRSRHTLDPKRTSATYQNVSSVQASHFLIVPLREFPYVYEILCTIVQRWSQPVCGLDP